MSILSKSTHQQDVEAFMLRAKQEVPLVPTEPSPEVRILRAKLILEEALETIKALGVSVATSAYGITVSPATSLVYEVYGDFNMDEVIDGCCDIAVVTTGTLSACGIPDVIFTEEVDRNNLEKFKPGHYWREDGKLMKPPGHQGPHIRYLLNQLAIACGLDYDRDANPYLARNHVKPTPSQTPPATSSENPTLPSCQYPAPPLGH